MFKFWLALKLVKMTLYDEHFQAFSGFCQGETEHFSVEKWRIKVEHFCGETKT